MGMAVAGAGIPIPIANVTKKEAVATDGGPIPPVRNRFGSSVYASANCLRTTRFTNDYTFFVY